MQTDNIAASRWTQRVLALLLQGWCGNTVVSNGWGLGHAVLCSQLFGLFLKWRYQEISYLAWGQHSWSVKESGSEPRSADLRWTHSPPVAPLLWAQSSLTSLSRWVEVWIAPAIPVLRWGLMTAWKAERQCRRRWVDLRWARWLEGTREHGMWGWQTDPVRRRELCRVLLLLSILWLFFPPNCFP